MFPAGSVFTIVLVALSVTASVVKIRDDVPNANLPFVMNLNLSGAKLPDIDRGRVAHLMTRGKQMDGFDLDGVNSLRRRASSIAATNAAFTYLAEVNVGNPATSYSLLVDTGSSNIWVNILCRTYATNTLNLLSGRCK